MIDKFIVVHNGRQKSRGTRHFVLGKQNQTLCGLSLKKDHVWFASRRMDASCPNCLKIMLKRMRKGRSILVVQEYFPRPYVMQNGVE